MKNKGTLTRSLALVGTVLVWLPMLAPLLLGFVSFILDGVFRFDYLMPAELFLLVVVGGGLLIWAALRARSRLAGIGWGLGIAIVALISSQFLAVLTGLASGETPMGGWQWAFVVGLYMVCLVAVVIIGISGVLLLRDLFKPAPLNLQN